VIIKVYRMLDMLTKEHEITFTFFDIGGGDAVWIRFLGTDKNWHNILIDGGYGYAYKMAFGPLINHLLSYGEKIDLWVITHIDRDHIGAVLGFIQDKKIKDKPQAAKEFWFNHSGTTVKTPNGKLAVDDGIKFRKYLTDNGLLTKEAITTSLASSNVFGLSITILSPTPEKLAIADALWLAEEKGGKIGRSKEMADHAKSIEDLQDLVFSGDPDAINGSSIGLFIKYKSVSTLLLGDSHADVVLATLQAHGYSEENPISVEFMQLAHHGSKANNSPDLLAMINTENYVITGNGIHNRHPDKETLVRLLVQKNRTTTPIQLHFPCNTTELATMFSPDQNAFERYNFNCSYHRTPNGTSFQYLPIND
jgi:beta-lactamase superfamily II metal-dependent hydrolase